LIEEFSLTPCLRFTCFHRSLTVAARMDQSRDRRGNVKSTMSNFHSRWHMKKALCVILLFLTPALGAQESKVDYNLARREIQTMESVIDTLVSSSFSGSPFAFVQKTKGVYLQGYGITFNFLVNIHLAVIKTPFGVVRQGREITPDEKRKRIEEMKDKLVRVLIDHGDTLSQLRKEESATIVAFFEDRRFLDEENHNKTLVLRAFKKDLDELARKEHRWKELKQRMEIVEY
jgi:hypothetical protein